MRSAGGVLLTALLCACSLFAPHKAPVVPPPANKPDQGLVYLYRDFSLVPNEARTVFTVKENGVVIGSLADGTYFFRYAKPGRAYYAALPAGSEDGKPEGGAFVEVVAGATHYVQIVPQAGADGVRALVFVKYPAQAAPAIERLVYARQDRAPKASAASDAPAPGAAP